MKRQGFLFLLAVPNRFNPQNMLARQLVETGELGIFTMPRPLISAGGNPVGMVYRPARLRGGPVLDIGVHRIDAAWYLMGNPKPVRVSAAVSNQLGDFQTKGVERWPGTPYPDGRYDTEDFGAGVIHF